MTTAAVHSRVDNVKPRDAETSGARHRRYQLPCGTDLTNEAPLDALLLTLAEAKAILADPVRDRRYVETRLGPVIEEYLRWKRLSNASSVTLDTYERILARLAVNLPPGVGIDEVTVEHLILVLDLVPPGSWKLHRAAYNGLFRWAIHRDMRSAKNPVEMLPGLLRQNRRPVYKVFAEDELAALATASRLMDDPARDRVRVYLLLQGGIRKGEARGLRMADVDPATKQVTVRGKGDYERAIPMRGDFWLAWESQLLEPIPRLGRLPEPDDHVWFAMRVAGEYQGRVRQVTAAYPERPMSQRAFHDWWKRLVGHAGIPYRKPHMTRHTFATSALDASEGDIYGVKELLGHASTKTTEIYLHSSKKRKESVAEALARFHQRQQPPDEL